MQIEFRKIVCDNCVDKVHDARGEIKIELGMAKIILHI